jgi:hypothetical protein
MILLLIIVLALILMTLNQLQKQNLVEMLEIVK